jgi:hypothetical protein|tara:strand:+ start:2879 stop:3043 length:165 start_codon:yes stop_codon:yes gene_type:complete
MGKHIANDGGCREPLAKAALRQKLWDQKNKMPKRQLEKDKQHGNEETYASQRGN